MYGGKRRGAGTDSGEAEWAKKRSPRKMKSVSEDSQEKMVSWISSKKRE